ncbi:MAG TPA: DUF4412 domain-containing protein [Steroidobacteraceae bacterium]|nr:DUF4412 domain-containing protein [Steroidobacteraceae bacterium]
MFKRLSLFAVLCTAAFASQSHADGLPAPTVSYSADRIMETEAGTFDGKVYFTQDKERLEMNARGMQSVMILRRDQQLGWMLMPAQRMYQKLDLARAQQQSGSQSADTVTIEQVGAETIEGYDATKYKMLMKDGSGGGFIWITQDGIPVKMDFLGKNGRDKTRMTVTLTNLTIGEQDPALFELPGDYKAMPSFPGFGGQPSGKNGLLGAAKGLFSRN